MAFWILALWAVSFVGNDFSGNSSGTLIYFSGLHCPACRQMQPAMDQLRAEGWNVRSIDTEKDRGTADRWRIQSIPTLILLQDGREVDRLVGGRTLTELKSRLGLFKEIGSPIEPEKPKQDSGRVIVQNDNNSLLGPNHPQFRSAYRINLDSSKGSSSGPQFPLEDHPLIGAKHPYHSLPFFRQARNGSSYAGSGKAKEANRPVYEIHPLLNGHRLPQLPQCMLATVRIRVESPESESVGTGTIIDTHSGEGLVITCGHLFRDRESRDQVFVELFSEGKSTKVRANVVDFKVDEVDIALVAFRHSFPVTTVPVLPKGERLQEEDPVFSIGCDHGANPSKRETIISKLNRYLGPSNVEIAGAPAQGRSGGGLFDSQGRLIGVCRAADYDLDEGLYAGPEVIYSQLEKQRLNRLYERR